MKKLVIIAVMFFLSLMALVSAQENATQASPLVTLAENETEATSQAQCSAVTTFFTGAAGKVRGAAAYALSRDYISAFNNTYAVFKGWSVTAKIFLVLAILIILFLLWNYFVRDTRANNLRRARTHHEKGEKAHLEGDEKKAQKHYEKARKHREKAQEQW